MLPVVFAHSVVVSRSLHHTTLHSTQNTSLVSSVVLFPRARRKCFFCHCFPLLYFLTAVHVLLILPLNISHYKNFSILFLKFNWLNLDLIINFCQREEKLEGSMTRMSSIAYTLLYLLGRLNEELFPEHRRCKHSWKKNQVHKICQWYDFASRR